MDRWRPDGVGESREPTSWEKKDHREWCEMVKAIPWQHVIETIMVKIGESWIAMFYVKTPGHDNQRLMIYNPKENTPYSFLG